MSNKGLSVMIKARFFPAKSPKATGKQPYLKYTLGGTRNQSIFSRRSDTVLIFKRWETVTFSLTELPPQVPHPNVRDGSNLKLYKSPIAP